MTLSSTTPTIDILRDSRGGFSMLAIDQRESLRQMLARAGGVTTVPDADVIAFKEKVVRYLSPLASAVLVDRAYSATAVASAACPVILAADLLYQSVPGGPVNRAELDAGVTAEVASEFGASVLKMLVPWLPDQRQEAISLSAEFMEMCRHLGLLGIVEGVVRPADFDSWTDDDKNDALVDAAADLGSTKPDLYKAEVPLFGVGDPDAIVATSRRVTESIDCPWVVLSSGVPADRYPAAVALAREGGASGFLAGRAVWADAITSDDPEGFLRTTSADRIRTLSGA